MHNAQCLGDGDPSQIRTLVISQHDAVRRPLVAYLNRTPGLFATGDVFGVEAVLKARPEVIVLDLSGIRRADLIALVDVVGRIGARLIALASLGDPADCEIVQRAGGIYRLKAAGAAGLDEIVRDIGGQAPARE